MAIKHKKETITHTLVENIEIYGDLDELIETLNKIKEDHPGYSNYYIDSYYDYDDKIYSVKGKRDETDEEFSNRVEYFKKIEKMKRDEKKALKEQHKKEIEKEARRLGLIK